ncbi:transmembrane protein [Gracilaria domingensis]|nr:transmembrane protein [Gracilaria domingensis]
MHLHGHLGEGVGDTDFDGDGEKDGEDELVGVTIADAVGDTELVCLREGEDDGDFDGDVDAVAKADPCDSEGDDRMAFPFEGVGELLTKFDVVGEAILSKDGVEVADPNAEVDGEGWLFGEGEPVGDTVMLAEGELMVEGEVLESGELLTDGDGDADEVIDAVTDGEAVNEGDGVALCSTQLPERSCTTAASAVSALLDFLLAYIPNGTAKQLASNAAGMPLNSAIFRRFVSSAASHSMWQFESTGFQQSQFRRVAEGCSQFVSASDSFRRSRTEERFDHQIRDIHHPFLSN